LPYSIYRDLTAGGGALIDQTSHWDVNLNTGTKLPASFEVPVEFEIDQDNQGRRMPTLFMVPTFVARKPFYDALVAAGVDNLDAYPTVIRDTATGNEWKDYLFLNVVGVVKCADLEASEYHEIGPDMRLMDRIAIQSDKVPTVHLFRLAEDKLKVVVSDHVYEQLRNQAFDDVYFQPVDVR
jgi:hypothetical protein